MIERRHRILSVIMSVVAAMCCTKVVLRLIFASPFDPIAMLLSVSWDVLLAVVLTLGARVAWGRGVKKVTMSEWE